MEAGTPPQEERQPPRRMHFLAAVAMLLLAAVAMLISRPYFPAALKPEYRLPEQTQSAAQAFRFGPPSRLPWAEPPELPGVMVGTTPVQALFEGHPLLILGDSEMVRWGIDADKICRKGSTIDGVRMALERAGGDRRYARIVIWAGGQGPACNVDFVPYYIEQMDLLLDVAYDHTDRITVIGPMGLENEDVQPDLRELRDWTGSYAVAMEAADLLALRRGDIDVFDVAAFRRRELSSEYFTADGMHMNGSGYAALTARLREQGLLEAT